MRLNMPDRLASRTPGAIVLLLLAVFAPPVVLLYTGLFTHVAVPWRLWAGIGIAGPLGVVLYRHLGSRLLRQVWGVLPSVIGIMCLCLAGPDWKSPFPHFSLAALLAIAAGTFAVQAVLKTGAIALRRARDLARQLATRRDWPTPLTACRTMRQVRALRDALADEAGPVMPLLSDPRPQVRVAALGALEYRKSWRAGQPDIVLIIAQSSSEPEVRGAALLALAGVQQRLLIEAMGESLRDPDPYVRRVAIEALLWDCERRWVWVRPAVREALADPRFSHDGPFTIPNRTLSTQAVADLCTWAMESGILGTRATQSIALHYKHKLDEGDDPELVAHLRDLVAHPRASTVLRVEMAHLLKRHGHLTEELTLMLVEPTVPSPLRLMAVESMLERFPNERAVDVLREVARQPNRELALAAAVVAQKFLHVDLGLALGEPPPALHTREAAEVTRRVIEWAKQTTPVGEPVSQASGW